MCFLSETSAKFNGLCTRYNFFHMLRMNADEDVVYSYFLFFEVFGCRLTAVKLAQLKVVTCVAFFHFSHLFGCAFGN